MSKTRSVFSAFVAACAFASGFASDAGAAQTAEERCQKALYTAAGRYVACQARVAAKIYGGEVHVFAARVSHCRDAYRAVWPLVQARFPGTSCGGDRFVDNGNGTVTDKLTRLMWEQKTDDGSVHDEDNAYTWSTADDLDGSDADGTVYTDFLAALNAGTCFAGQCGWRLPTRDELQTIVAEPYPCSSSPCIDPIFGPTPSNFFWSETNDAFTPNGVWGVYFPDGGPVSGSKTANLSARAVRGGF